MWEKDTRGLGCSESQAANREVHKSRESLDAIRSAFERIDKTYKLDRRHPDLRDLDPGADVRESHRVLDRPLRRGSESEEREHHVPRPRDVGDRVDQFDLHVRITRA